MPMLLKCQCLIWSSWVLHMLKTKQMGWITHFIEDSENQDYYYGATLLLGLLSAILVEHYLDNHTGDANMEVGFAFQKSTDALLIRKLLRLTSATTKNYENG